MRLPVIAVAFALVASSYGQAVNGTSESLAGEDSGLRGKVENKRFPVDTALVTQRHLSKTTSSTATEGTETIREGRSHVNEAEPGDDLGTKEELIDTGDSGMKAKVAHGATAKKATSTTATKMARTSKVNSSSNGKASGGTGSAGTTKVSSTGTKTVANGEGRTQRASSNGNALGKEKDDSGLEKEVEGMGKKTISSSEKGESGGATESIGTSEVASHSSRAYVPSICGKSRTDVEAICNTDTPICKYETEQPSGNKPFHITTKLRPNQDGACIRRCDSRWGLSKEHCQDDEECFEDIVAFTKFALLSKRGCEAF